MSSDETCKVLRHSQRLAEANAEICRLRERLALAIRIGQKAISPSDSEWDTLEELRVMGGAK